MASGPGKRGGKSKGAPAFNENLIALGTVSGPSTSVPKPPAKREAPSVIVTNLSAKKPKIGQPEKVVESYELLEKLESDQRDERSTSHVLSSIASIKSSRGRDNLSMLTLLYLSKTQPEIFQSAPVVENLVSLMKRDPALNYKQRPSNSLQIFAANLLFSTLKDQNEWPVSLIKVFVEDSLSERLWVDAPENKGFVENLVTGFRTYIPNKSFLNPEISLVKGDYPNSPTRINEDSSDSKDFTSESGIEDLSVVRRFTEEQEDLISGHVKDVINEQLNRKPASEISRNLLRLLMTTVGVQSIRPLIAQKLEVWLQNPKIQKPAQDLTRFLVLNLGEADSEVVSMMIKTLQKIRSKPIVNHFVNCVKELLALKPEMTAIFLQESVASYIGEVNVATRVSNNLQLISTIFQASSSEKCTIILSNLFIQYIVKEDNLKTFRALLREVVRTLRHDHINLTLFVKTLCEERSVYNIIESADHSTRERIFQSVIDIITLSMFLSVSPSIKEAASAPKSDRREVMKLFQMQVAEIERCGVKWLCDVSQKLRLERNEFMHGLNKLLIMEPAEQYCSRDNYPPEGERNLIFRLCTEVPLLEDTLIRILDMALSRSYPILPTDAIEISDQLIRRAATCYDPEASNFGVLVMKNEKIFDLLLNCSTYRMPDNISLPAGYEPPSLAISDWYWKVWNQLLVLTAHNTSNFGLKAWKSFPTLSLIIEMAITSHFEFPPPTHPSDEMRMHEAQINMMERQQILQFETHLAAASTKMAITESTSLLISKLMTFDPTGVARRPPNNVLEQLKSLNSSLKIGHLLCQSRRPDFLLEIIQRQQRSSNAKDGFSSASPVSMPWLNHLVELHEDSYSALPVQCLCEFLMGQIHEKSSQTTKEEKSTSSTNAEILREKDRKRKLKKLVAYFRNTLSSSKQESNYGQAKNLAREMMEYFMKRFGSQHSIFRRLASSALEVIFSPVSEDEDMTIDFCGNKNLFLDILPTTGGFDDVRDVTCEALRWSLLVETSPASICKYVEFLACHSLQSDSETATNVARFLIERQTVTRAIVSGKDDSFKKSFLISSNKILNNYLVSSLQKKPPEQWPTDSDKVLVVWSDLGQTAVISEIIIQASIMLLVYGPAEGCELEFDHQMSLWFCTPPPKVYSVETREETPLLPDPIKFHLLRSSSETLVDAALVDLDTMALVIFIQSFGLPVQSMNKLLKLLDERCSNPREVEILKSNIADEEFMRNWIKVQWMRGATSGHKFAAILGLNHEKSGSLSIGEQKETATKQEESELNKVKIGDKSISVSDDLVDLTNATPSRISALFCDWLKTTSTKHDPFLSKLSKVIGRELLDVKKAAKKGLLAERIILDINSILSCSPTTSSKSQSPKKQTPSTSHKSRSDLINKFKNNCLDSLLLMVATIVSSKSNSQKIFPPSYASLVSSLTKMLTILGSNEETKKFSILNSLSWILLQFEKKEKITITGASPSHSFLPTNQENSYCPKEAGNKAKITISNENNEAAGTSESERNLPTTFDEKDDEGDEDEKIERQEFMKQQTRVLKSITDSRSLDYYIQSENELEKAVEDIFCHSSLYLLPILLHKSNFDTIRNIVKKLLNRDNDKQFALKYKPSVVLNFITGALDHPLLWKGRDVRKPTHFVLEDVLKLKEEEVSSLIDYVLEEGCIETRVDLLVRCTFFNETLVQLLLNKLASASVCLSTDGHQQAKGHHHQVVNNERTEGEATRCSSELLSRVPASSYDLNLCSQQLVAYLRSLSFSSSSCFGDKSS